MTTHKQQTFESNIYSSSPAYYQHTLVTLTVTRANEAFKEASYIPRIYLLAHCPLHVLRITEGFD